MCRDIGESLERGADFILQVITGDDTQVYRHDADLRMSTQFKRNRQKHLAILYMKLRRLIRLGTRGLPLFILLKLIHAMKCFYYCNVNETGSAL